MPLHDLKAWKPLAESLRGKRWGYCQSPANVGDKLIARGTFRVLGHYGIEFVNWHGPDTECDGLLMSGGGNLGTKYPACARYRWLILETAKEKELPVVVLPQTASDKVDLGERVTVWLREHVSARYYPKGKFAHDLSLAFDPGALPEAKLDVGVYLRRDGEARFKDMPSEGDPAVKCITPEDYCWLAARYREIVTDRLHFAIAGLLAGRKVTLLPCNYHKSRSVWEASLKELGCLWREEP